MNVNELYVKEEIVEEMGTFFTNEGFLQLIDFLEPDKVEAAQRVLESKTSKQEYVPDSHSKVIFTESEIIEVEILEILEFFKSTEFKELLESVTNLDLELASLNLVSYGKKDYTLLHDSHEHEDELEIHFDMTKDWTDDLGGILTYTTKHDELLYLEPMLNCLTIVFKEQSLMSYLKYINHLAEDKRIFRIEMKWKID